ncbi:histidinol-phosphatase [Aquirhabdus parva]|uniref:HAD family hydrolase n=1 Tax=Aquirhabdus parva TaxID=2283318 RepID=A0A345P8K3_9GAMM|nr:HAD family hydrolase [Aquirhabdus parva]AXI03612.1 HAD family hydrolase [Aquirhabdus parva]
MQLALFDLDHTLLDLDSDHEWGEFLIAQGLVDEAEHRKRNDQFYADYQSGTLDAVAYNEFVFQFLKGKAPSVLKAISDQYLDTIIRPAMRPLGIAAIEKHRQAGHEIVIITATNSFVTAPIAQAFGVSHLIASEPEIIDGVYTGKLVGEPCFQAGKLHHLNAWLAQHNPDQKLENSWGYSDSFNDLPLLNFVDHPITVTPDKRLHAHALDHQWPVENWSVRAGVWG